MALDDIKRFVSNKIDEFQNWNNNRRNEEQEDRNNGRPVGGLAKVWDKAKNAVNDRYGQFQQYRSRQRQARARQHRIEKMARHMHDQTTEWNGQAARRRLESQPDAPLFNRLADRWAAWQGDRVRPKVERRLAKRGQAWQQAQRRNTRYAGNLDGIVH